jgi:hypothetical protein
LGGKLWVARIAYTAWLQRRLDEAAGREPARG